jgi:hypothetical protein
MKDENSTEMKVVLDGAKPNNFEMAENVVAKEKLKTDIFTLKKSSQNVLQNMKARVKT